jgi:XTP/dITP diphosphohydrolase
METIILASSNKHKIKQFKEIYTDTQILSLEDIGFFQEIDETVTTFLENALIKAKCVSEYAISKGYMFPVIADDSGLEVDALNGEPGVYSARYAGDHDFKKNRDYLISKLKSITDRSAQLTCCLVKYYLSGEYIYAYGKTDGHIIDEELGDTSFGYECIFYSKELKKTFGEASSEEKNLISHRARAIKELKNVESSDQKCKLLRDFDKN